MTDQQKQLTTALRSQGLGYRSIASRIGISVNTVKSYCRKQKLKSQKSTEPVSIDDAYCPVCGAKLIQIPHKRQKRFCSDKCRIKYWASHGNSGHSTKCLNCGRAFNSTHSTRKFCSHECYIQYRFHGGQNEV